MRTVALLRYLADPALRRRVTAVTNKALRLRPQAFDPELTDIDFDTLAEAA